MIIANIVALIILLVGGLNWGLVGIFNWNLVSAIFGVRTAGEIIVYVLVLLSAIWLIISALLDRKIRLCETNRNRK